MTKWPELETEGDLDPLPYKVIWGVKVEAAFATLAEAEKYTKPKLGKKYQIWNGNRLLFGKPYTETVRDKNINLG